MNEPDQPDDSVPVEKSAAALAGTVLAEEAARREAEDAAAEASVRADQDLPGVGDETMSLRDGLAAGGVSTISVLALLNAFDELDNAAATLLAPEIQDTLGVSDLGIAVTTVGGLIFVVAGGLGLGRLADNSRRPTIVGIATIFWSIIVFFTGFVVNAFWYFIARSLTAIGKSNTHPVQGPILADAYPIPARARIYAINNVVGRLGGLVAPLALGALVGLIGGDEAWRWAFWVGAVPTLFLGVVVLFLKDPPRGQYEQKSTIGEVIAETDQPPISMGATWQRISQIRTFKTALVGFCALGFTFVSVPLFVNLYLEDRFDLSAFERAIVTSVPGFLALLVIPLVAKRFDGLYRESPPKALALIGGLFLPIAVLVPIQMSMPSPLGFAAVGALTVVISSAIFAMVGPLFAAITPYRLRSQGVAIGMGMILGIGGVGGAIIGGLISDALGPRWAVILIAIPANLVGGLMLMNGARFIRNDLSLIAEEIEEEQAEHDRMTRDPEHVPVLQVNNVDFAYGQVQVLFDVGFQVARGETLALLGTNGAGKSTALRVISGLAIPRRGVVRLNGQTITLTSPETRVKLGIHQLPGGKALFDPMSVGDNLAMAAYIYDDKADARRRIDRSLEVFPQLADRLDDRAGDLSGGQQQMLGLAMALIHDPEVLLIDELSLGLAPVIVEQLLQVVERLKEAGQTMIIVEQSLNVALAIADRAIFMEKGQVKFEGPAQELLERDDLARAVFLGGEQA
jgi:ABC-type branched-subunit amino acid transport system ATPase component/predicted MFS family arabinose efflux permease